MSIELDALAIILLAMAAGGVVKGATGMGLPQVAIPVMATFLGVEAAVVIMAIPGIVTNTWMLWNHRSSYKQTRDLPTLLVLGAVGTIAGSLALDSLNEDVLSFILAAMIGLYVVVFFSHPNLRLTPGFTRIASPPVGVAAGLLQGSTGMSGPLISTYLHSYRMERAVFVVALTTIFQFFAVVQAATLLGVGLYTTERFVLSILSVFAAMASLPLGERLGARWSRRTFEITVIVILVASATKLIYDAVT
ncbi:MAG: sulfite exporter TauE/SafE family protein [Actinomycetota bacterium]